MHYKSDVLVRVLCCIFFALLPARLQAGSISGKILESVTGTPIPGVEVWANADKETDGFAVSGSDGVYSIPNLSADIYTILVIDPSRTFIAQYYINAFEEDSAEVLALSANESKKNIDLTLKRGASISGTVTLSEGGTIPETVSVCAGSINGDLKCADAVQQNGNFIIFDLIPGEKYWILGDGLEDLGYFNASMSYFIFTEGEQATGLEVAFVKVSMAISGTVINSNTDVGISGVNVILYSDDVEVLSVSSDADGNYIIPIYSNGTYTVMAFAPDSNYTDKYWQDTAELDKAEAIVIDDNTTPLQNIDFYLEKVYTSTDVPVVGFSGIIVCIILVILTFYLNQDTQRIV